MSWKGFWDFLSWHLCGFVTDTTVLQCQVSPNWNWAEGQRRSQHLHDLLFFSVTRKFWFAHWFGPALPEKSPGMYRLLFWTSWCQDCSLWSVTPKFYRYVGFQTTAELHPGPGVSGGISGTEVALAFMPAHFWFTAQIYPFPKRNSYAFMIVTIFH